MTRWNISISCLIRKENPTRTEQPGEVGPFSGELVFSVEANSKEDAVQDLARDLERLIQKEEDTYSIRRTYVEGRIG